jgi:hypothetical protein
VGQFTDRDEAVDAAEIRERSIRLDSHDRGGADLPGLEGCEDLFAGGFALRQLGRLAAEHETVLVLAELEDLAGELLAEKDRDVRHGAKIDLTRGHESAVMGDLHLEPALVHADAAGLHHLSDGEIAPVGLLHHPRQGEDQQAFEGVEPFDDELVRRTGRRRFLELGERADALALGAELDEDLSGVDPHDRSAARGPEARGVSARADRRARVVEHVVHAHPREGFVDLALQRGVDGGLLAGESRRVGCTWIGRRNVVLKAHVGGSSS